MNHMRLENDSFAVEIAQPGAELKCLESKKSGRNYIYKGTGSWKRSSPVLFPNIGGLAGGVYCYDGQEYPAPPHGFARDMGFALKEKSLDRAVFSLKSSAETAKYFPFVFELEITYALTDSGISVVWRVVNEDSRTMYFSIGAHPGFALLPGTKLSDYVLRFETPVKIETRRVIGRYLTQEKEKITERCDVFPLSPYRMKKDAIVLEDTGLSGITLESQKHHYSLQIKFENFPVVAVWTDPHTVSEAEFICLEPWCGINALCQEEKADISGKSRVNSLVAGEVFTRNYQIAIVE